MMDKIKRIDIKEFREKGYLQELNRRFLHPLGLALEVVINDVDGSEILGGVWDYREDVEGIYYDIANSDSERKTKFTEKKTFIDSEFDRRLKNKKEKLGFDIEPLN